MEPNPDYTTRRSSLIYALYLACSCLLLLTSCNSTTVLLANFNNDTIGSPPGATQSTGTVQLTPGSGLITFVSEPPSGEQHANKWALITHPAQPAPETKMTGRFTKWGIGSYGILASLHIPANSGVVTVQLEAANPLGSFMHLDFMPEGDIRIDDDESLRFGSFPRDENFVLSIGMNITDTSATADITVTGNGASGNKVVNVKPIFLNVARNFGACTFWVGYQHNASFYVDDIIVTKKN